MIRLCLLLGIILGSTQVYAQQFPLFKDKKDSIAYAKLINLLRPQTDSVRVVINYDSLRRLEEAYKKKAVGYINVYRPNREFTAYADLKSGKVNPDSVRWLSISNLRAAELPKEVFTCKNLEALEIVNARIDKIQSAVATLPHLTALYLYNNVPTHRLVLEKNNTITYLRIAGHHPHKLPKHYANFAALDSLNLNRANVTRFPNIRGNTELKVVSLVGNYITLKRYPKNKSLEHLNLRMNRVTKVPNSIGRKYPSLKALSFNTNPVATVKPGLSKLSHLKYLSFYNNQLTQIPAPVYQLTNLEVIDLFENRIEFVDPQISNLQQLKVLYLANNRLYRLPDEIGDLKNLEELYVYNNRMDTLPASTDKLEKLRVLWVNDNFFHSIPAATWRIKNMDYLDASQNFITDVPQEIGNTRLSTIILSGSLLYKERNHADMFKKLREQGTRIIYYTAATDVKEDDEGF